MPIKIRINYINIDIYESYFDFVMYFTMRRFQKKNVARTFDNQYDKYRSETSFEVIFRLDFGQIF